MIFLLRALLLGILTGIAVYAQHPYYVRNETFALSTRAFQGRYIVTTFLPRRLLLFIDDRNYLKAISGKQYLRARTQDGVEVYVLESYVSDKPFRVSIGRLEVIFNSAHVLCRTIGCDLQDDEQAWRVDPGFAFKKTGPDASGILTLENDELVGYIAARQLQDLVKRGVATRVDLPHPKYTVRRFESPTCATQCGEVRIANSLTPLENPNLSEWDDRVLREFNLGSFVPNGDKIRWSRDYGERDRQYRYFIYDFKNNRTGGRFHFIAQVIYRCRQLGAETILGRTESVLLKGRQPLLYSDFATPDLSSYVPHPFLFSVNSYTQYAQLMDRLGQIFQDRALAGYFLSEFNRSCYSKDRSKPACSSHSY